MHTYNLSEDDKLNGADKLKLEIWHFQFMARVHFPPITM